MKYVAMDVDGTLTSSNVSFAFGHFLYRKKRISFFQAIVPALYYVAHYVGWISLERMQKLIFKILFFGKTHEWVEQSADEFFHVYGSTLIRHKVKEEVDALRREEAHVALLSSSPDFLVKRIAKMIAVDEWHATEYRVNEYGIFSSIGLIITGFVKRDIVREAKRRYGDRIMAMTDSILDLPLLEEAHEVIVVCPDRKLSRCAKQRGWRIVGG